VTPHVFERGVVEGLEWAICDAHGRTVETLSRPKPIYGPDGRDIALRGKGAETALAILLLLVAERDRVRARVLSRHNVAFRARGIETKYLLTTIDLAASPEGGSWAPEAVLRCLERWAGLSANAGHPVAPPVPSEHHRAAELRTVSPYDSLSRRYFAEWLKVTYLKLPAAPALWRPRRAMAN
jgi:hypothetical protein